MKIDLTIHIPDPADMVAACHLESEIARVIGETKIGKITTCRWSTDEFHERLRKAIEAVE